MNKEFYFFLPDMECGGAQKVFLNLLHYLSHKKNKSTLILFKKEGEFLKQLPHNTKVISLLKKNSSFINYPIAFIKLCFFLKKNNVDIVMSSLTGANIMLLMARNIYSKKTKIIIQEVSTLTNINSHIKRLFAKLVYKSSDKIITVSEGIKTDLIDHFDIASHLIHVIFTPIDIKQIKHLSEKKINEDYFNTRKKTIISVGRLVEAKGFKTLINAFNLVHTEVDVQLIIIGDGEQEEILSKLIHDLNLEQKIQLIGYRKNPYQYMKHADLFVLSSNWEGLPNVILEALSLNLPIVSTDCHSGPREIQQILCNDIQLVPVSDHEAMAKKIIKVLKNEKKNTHNNIQKLDINIVNKKYLDFINNIR